MGDRRSLFRGRWLGFCRGCLGIVDSLRRWRLGLGRSHEKDATGDVACNWQPARADPSGDRIRGTCRDRSHTVTARICSLSSTLSCGNARSTSTDPPYERRAVSIPSLSLVLLTFAVYRHFFFFFFVLGFFKAIPERAARRETIAWIRAEFECGRGIQDVEILTGRLSSIRRDLREILPSIRLASSMR